MTDAQIFFILWLCVAVIMTLIGTYQYLEARGFADRRYYARMILLSPVWPIGLVYWIIFVLPFVIIELIQDATS